MAKAKLVKIGNNLCLIIPNETVERLNLSIGDEIDILQDNQGITLKKEDSNFSAYVETAREIMRDYDLTMRDLSN